jgi:hypothetical protein
VLTTETECVYCEVRTETVNVIQVNLVFSGFSADFRSGSYHFVDVVITSVSIPDGIIGIFH